MSERPSPGSLKIIRNALDDAEIVSHSPLTITVHFVSPNRAAAFARVIADLQKEGPDR